MKDIQSGRLRVCMSDSAAYRPSLSVLTQYGIDLPDEGIPDLERTLRDRGSILHMTYQLGLGVTYCITYLEVVGDVIKPRLVVYATGTRARSGRRAQEGLRRILIIRHLGKLWACVSGRGSGVVVGRHGGRRARCNWEVCGKLGNWTASPGA